MKEHSLFLEAAFGERDAEFKKIASKFHKSFSDILEKITILADKNVTSDFLSFAEIVTKDTMDVEKKTNALLGVDIDTTITEKERNLQTGEMNTSVSFVQNIRYMNQNTLPLIHREANHFIRILNSQKPLI